MPDIRFIGLNQAEQGAQMRRLCQRLESLTGEGKRVIVVAGDATAARWFDERLWTYDDSSFIPHARVAETVPSPLNRLIIVEGEVPHYRCDVVVNLATPPLIPAQLSAGQLVFEVFRQDTEEGQESGRKKWAMYKEAGQNPTKGAL